jgi:hypothetical protein
MNVNIKSKPAMLATFVVLVGLVSIIFSHSVQAQGFFGLGGDTGTGAGNGGSANGGSANGANANGGDAHGNNGNTNSG